MFITTWTTVQVHVSHFKFFFQFSQYNWEKKIQSKSSKEPAPAVLKCHLLADKEIISYENRHILQCNRSLKMFIILQDSCNTTASWSHMCKMGFCFTPPWQEYEMTQDCMFFWLLIHSNCPCLSVSLKSVCLFIPLLLSVTVSALLCSHAEREGGVRRPWGKGRERRSRTYFPAVTFTMMLCYRVINRGLLPQGQPGAKGTGGAKGQKVSHINVKCQAWWVPLFMLPQTHCAWVRKGCRQVQADLLTPWFSLFCASYVPGLWIGYLSKVFEIVMHQIMNLQVCITCLSLVLQ